MSDNSNLEQIWLSYHRKSKLSTAKYQPAKQIARTWAQVSSVNSNKKKRINFSSINQTSLFPRGLLAILLYRNLSYQINIKFCILMMLHKVTLQGYKQEKDCREMKYLVLEHMASFKVHTFFGSLHTWNVLGCLLGFFFPSYSIWLNKRYCSCWQNFPSGKVCLFLVCCSKKQKNPKNQKNLQTNKQTLPPPKQNKTNQKNSKKPNQKKSPKNKQTQNKTNTSSQCCF